MSPIAAADTRAWYCEFMESIYDNRHTILEEYFRSIGITGTAMSEWDQVSAHIQPIYRFVCRPFALK